MGKNTPERQRFIIDNLKVEKDVENLTLLEAENRTVSEELSV